MENKENKFVSSFRKYFKAYLITFIVTIVIASAIFLLMFFFAPNKMSFYGAFNGLTVASFIILGVAGLVFVANEGMFDSLTYGANQLATAMFNKKANKYNDYNGYLEKKKEARIHSPRYHMAILFASIPFVIATIVMFIIYKVSI